MRNARSRAMPPAIASEEMPSAPISALIPMASRMTSQRRVAMFLVLPGGFAKGGREPKRALVRRQPSRLIQVFGYSGVQVFGTNFPEHLNTRIPERLNVGLWLCAAPVSGRLPLRSADEKERGFGSQAALSSFQA